MAISKTILTIFFQLTLLVQNVVSITIPGPNPDSHTYKISVAHFSLTDVTKKDPYSSPQPRKVMTSLFIPIPKTDCTHECQNSYMPPQTAQTTSTQLLSNSTPNLFQNLSYTTCCNTSRPINASTYPVVVLEPQVATTRYLYSTLARHIAANGAAVVIIDHPHDASIVEFPFSRTINNNGTIPLSPFEQLASWNKTVTRAIETRMRDIQFVLSQLGDAKLLRRQFRGIGFETGFRPGNGYVVVGHGVGGSTATALSVLDDRVRFSINMSGSAPLVERAVAASSMFPSNSLECRDCGLLDTSQTTLLTIPPVYFFGRTAFRRDSDIHWPTTWSHLTGKATEWDLDSASIFAFSDLPLIVDLARQNSTTYLGAVKGLQHRDPEDFYATACFIAAYLKVEGVVQRDWAALGKCLERFPRMVPYPGILEGSK